MIYTIYLATGIVCTLALTGFGLCKKRRACKNCKHCLYVNYVGNKYCDVFKEFNHFDPKYCSSFERRDT